MEFSICLNIRDLNSFEETVKITNTLASDNPVRYEVLWKEYSASSEVRVKVYVEKPYTVFMLGKLFSDLNSKKQLLVPEKKNDTLKVPKGIYWGIYIIMFVLVALFLYYMIMSIEYPIP